MATVEDNDDGIALYSAKHDEGSLLFSDKKSIPIGYGPGMISPDALERADNIIDDHD